VGSQGTITQAMYDERVAFGLHFNKATKIVANLSKPEDKTFPTGTVLKVVARLSISCIINNSTILMTVWM
jgi:hypothetical protein